MPIDPPAQTITLKRAAKPQGLWRGLLRSVGLAKDAGQPHLTTAFSSALIVLGAKMAAADGCAVKAEAEVFERFLEIPPGREPDVRRLYDQAKLDAAGYEDYAVRVAGMLHDEPGLKRDVLECLLYIACADGILHPAEDKFLLVVAETFGYSELEFRAIRALFVHDPESPYAVLGVAPDAPLREIKAMYRKLVTDNHPDKLASKTAAPAVIKAATSKVAAYNAAYDAILKERGQLEAGRS
jgi:DnaJ like chaperone protein